MSRERWTIFSLAYITGLLATGVWGFPNPHPTLQQWLFVIVILGLLPFIVAWFLKQFSVRCPSAKFWLGVSLVAILGAIYFQFRVPQPSVNDISRIFSKNTSYYQFVTVSGKILSEPRLTSDQGQKFWLKAQKVDLNSSDHSDAKRVSGKLYVTIPLKTKNQLYPGQTITITGGLYKPRSPTNPGAFDFRAYLASQGTYAGLKGERIIHLGNVPFWGWWKLRQPIVNSFTQGLGSPEGLLLSSMVLGRQAVDLSVEIRDLFMKTGLAHVLAASGFHVVLLLGIILRLTRNLSPKQQLIIGISSLFFYGGLTGLQPSICRAILMGTAVLIGQTVQRKIIILNSLLLAATLLLLWQPLWIWDLGFQFSFLSTFGLIVTIPPLMKRLDWLPPAIATLIAVPLAATIWVLPLSLYKFSILATYSIPTNIITSPLITAISIGGMISSAIAFISPILGSFVVKILYYPVYFLIKSLEIIVHLPGSYYAVGKLSLGVMLLIYVILVLIWLNPFWQRYWKLAALFSLGLIILPIIYQNLTLIKVTILEAKSNPVVVIQDRGKVSLINLGNEEAIKYTILPFLSQQGINKIHAVLVFDSQSIRDWLIVNPYITVDRFFHNVGETQSNSQQLSSGQILRLGSTFIEFLASQPLLVSFKVSHQSWLWITENVQKQTFLQKALNIPNSVVLWSGKSVSLNQLIKLNPKVAIANSSYIPKKVRQELQTRNIDFYWTRQNGAIQWTPNKGFITTVISAEQNEF